LVFAIVVEVAVGDVDYIDAHFPARHRLPAMHQCHGVALAVIAVVGIVVAVNVIGDDDDDDDVVFEVVVEDARPCHTALVASDALT